MTPRTYSSPASFKQALEQRLRSSASGGAAFARKRQLLLFDRFLAGIVLGGCFLRAPYVAAGFEGWCRMNRTCFSALATRADTGIESAGTHAPPRRADAQMRGSATYGDCTVDVALHGATVSARAA